MTATIVHQFKEMYESLAGTVHVVAGPAAAADTIASILEDANAQCVALAGLAEGLQQAVEERCGRQGVQVFKPPYQSASLPHAIDAAQVGISAAAFGIAETGTLVETATDDAHRLVSALPRIHIGLVRAGDLVKTLAEAAPRLREIYRQNPTNCAVTFISGPSRTADIEMQLTLGVHGPAHAHAIVVQEEVADSAAEAQDDV